MILFFECPECIITHYCQPELVSGSCYKLALMNAIRFRNKFGMTLKISLVHKTDNHILF